MAFYLLLHGAWHGGWCWADVAAELAKAGHASAAPDLPVDDVAAGWVEYQVAAMRALRGARDPVVAVGHSLAGGVIPMIAAARPVSRMVFLASFPPEPKKSLDEALTDEPELTDPRALAFRDSVDEQGRYVWPSFETARNAMYHDVGVDRARDAFARLRPQATRPFSQRWPLDVWPQAPVSFVVCAEDRMGRAERLREVARRRFDVEAIEIGGGHSPFLSRPAQLAEVLMVES
jgi:hypothetical protein